MPAKENYKDIPVVSYENNVEMWHAIGDDKTCLLYEFETDIQKIVEWFVQSTGRVPEKIYFCNKKYYIPETEEEYMAWKARRKYTI